MEQIILDIIEFLKQFSYFGVVLALTFEFIPAEVVFAYGWILGVRG